MAVAHTVEPSARGRGKLARAVTGTMELPAGHRLFCSIATGHATLPPVPALSGRVTSQKPSMPCQATDATAAPHRLIPPPLLSLHTPMPAHPRLSSLGVAEAANRRACSAFSLARCEYASADPVKRPPNRTPRRRHCQLDADPAWKQLVWSLPS